MIAKSLHQHSIFYPKLFSTLKEYSAATFIADAISGVIVGVVALPLAIAFAIASGVTPEKGLITAVVAGFLISALGGSRVQIGGPTGAFVVIVYGIVAKYGQEGLIVCTLMAGVILIGMGWLRLGSLIKFIPYPLIVGFTSGIAVIIFSSQIKDAMGLRIGSVPAEFIAKWRLFISNIDTINPTAFLLFGLSVAVILAWQRYFRKIPGSIVAILLVTTLARVFDLQVETIGSRFGNLPSGFPTPALPALHWSQIQTLISPALTVAILGSIESLLSATVADGMIESRHRSNTELIAQGLANIGSSMFGGIPATGAVARTITNVKNGGKTPIAGIVHALTLLLILIVFGTWAKLIPLCVLAAILVIVAFHMSEWRSFHALLRSPRTDVIILLVTFFLTVFVDLTVAVEVGIVLSAIFFMKHMTDATSIRDITGESDDESELRSAQDAVSKRNIPNGIKVYEAEGALFFGVAESLRDNLRLGGTAPKAIIFRLRHVLTLDATGLRALADLWKGCKNQGTTFIIEGARRQPLKAIKESGLLEKLGEENIHRSLDDALRKARASLV